MKTASRWVGGASDPDTITSFNWDRNGNLLTVTSDAARGTGRDVATTQYFYDALDRLEAIERPGGMSESFDYMGTSPLVWFHTDPRGVVTTFDYDAAGAVTSMVASLGDEQQTRTYDTDAFGCILSAHTTVHGEPLATTLAWDSLGNRLRESGAMVSGAVEHDIDNLGRRTHSHLPMTAAAIARSHNPLGRLETIALEDNASGLLDGTASASASFVYEGLGGPTSRVLSNGVATDYTYDPLGRLTSITSDVARHRYAFGLDGVPRAHTADTPLGVTTSAFSVDRGGRLLAEAHGIPGAAGTLDPFAGRDAAESFAGDLLDQAGIAQAPWRSYTLDGRDNWVARDAGDPALTGAIEPGALDAYDSFQNESATYDAAGGFTSTGPSADPDTDDLTVDYDLFGQVIWAATADSSRSYTYDALGRLVRETLVGAHSPGSGRTDRARSAGRCR